MKWWVEFPQEKLKTSLAPLADGLPNDLAFLLVILRQPRLDDWSALLKKVNLRGPLIETEGKTLMVQQSMNAIAHNAEIKEEQQLIKEIAYSVKETYGEMDAERLRDVLTEAAGRYKQLKAGCNFTIEKNFLIRVGQWLNYYYEKAQGKPSCFVVFEDIKLNEYFAAWVLYRLGGAVILIPGGNNTLPTGLAGLEAFFQWTGSGAPAKVDELKQAIGNLSRQRESAKQVQNMSQKAYGATVKMPLDPFKSPFEPLENRTGFLGGEYPLIVSYSGCMIGVHDDLNEYYNKLYLYREALEQKPDNSHVYIDSIPIPNDMVLVNRAKEALGQINMDLTTPQEWIMALDKGNCFQFITNLKLKNALSVKLIEIMDIYNEHHKGNSSAAKNFLVKLILWLKPIMASFSHVVTAAMHKKSPIDGYQVLYYGNIKDHEALFLMLLSAMGIDVLYVNSFTDAPFDRLDSTGQYLPKIGLPSHHPLQPFPEKEIVTRMSTVASRASEEIEKIVYGEDSGIIKNWQYDDYGTIALSLKTTYEEIKTLWPYDARLREGFKAQNKKVYIPNLFAKVSGVPRNIAEYWADVQIFKNCPQAYFTTELPLVTPAVAEGDLYFIKGMIAADHVDRERLKGSAIYKLQYLKTPTQELIIDKIEETVFSSFWVQKLKIEDKARIVAVLLGLDKFYYNLIHSFDKPFSIPKIVLYHNDESVLSMDDAAFLIFFKRVGMDTVIFNPTGYNNIESWIVPEAYDTYRLETVQFNLRFQDNKDESLGGFFKNLFGM